MTTEDIVRELELGNSITLESGKTYNFTDKHSIKVRGILNGNNATIISNKLFINQQLTFLFNVEGGTINNLNIIGPNAHIGPPNIIDCWGAVNILTEGIITNCNFSNCDKWAIKCTSHPSKVHRIVISNCTFNNIRRGGFGYGIWNQYGDVLIENCKFTNCRHGVDGSSKVFKTNIQNCEFDKGNYIHINMHAYSDDFRGGHTVNINNCNFYDIAQPIELKLPYPENEGLISVTNCNFYLPYGKLGKIVETEPIENFQNKQYSFVNNTVDGANLIPMSEIVGPEIVNINEKHSYSTSNFDSYVWSNGGTKNKITRTVTKPQVGIIDVYGIKSKQRSLRKYKKIEVKEPGKNYLSFFIKGWGCVVEVLRDNVIIDTITDSKFIDWKNFVYYGAGSYKLKVKGTGNLYLDDWCQESFNTTLEDKLDLKLKYIIDGNKSIGVDMFKGDARSGIGCLRMRLPSPLSELEIEKR